MLSIIRTFLFLFRVSLLKSGGGTLPIRKLRELDDHKLMIQYAKHGNTAAFEILLQRYREQLFGYLVQSCRNRATAEDLYQEVFFRVIRASKSYNTKASFRTWIFSIARNLMIDEYRKKKTQPIMQSIEVSETGNSPETALDSINNHPNIDQQVKALEIRRVLAEALRRLPDEQREIFHLRESAGLSFQEAAEIAGCSVNTAKSRMRYAMLRIREFFEDRDILPQETD